jgi:hypothetical protein
MKRLTLTWILMTALCFVPSVSAQEGAADWGFENEDAPRETISQTINASDQPNWDGQTGVIWNEQPMRETLGNFATHHRLGFLLDRRVDPDTLISLDVKQTTVCEVFERVAKQHGLAFCEFETVAYIGPVDAAEQLRLLAALRSEQLAKLPENKRAGMLTPISFHTEPFDEPAASIMSIILFCSESNLIRSIIGLVSEHWEKTLSNQDDNTSS